MKLFALILLIAMFTLGSGATAVGDIVTLFDNPNRADLIYNPLTGGVLLDASDADGGIITNFVVKNETSGFSAVTNPFPEELKGFSKFGTSVSTAAEISWTDLFALSDPIWTTHPGTNAAWDMGAVFPTGMDQQQLEAFLTQSTYVGAAGTGVWNLDITATTAVPEPGTLTLLVTGAVCLLGYNRRRHQLR